MAQKTTSNGVAKGAVGVMASIARSVVKDSIDGRCIFLMHQPKEPKDLARRLELLQKK